MKLLIGLLTIFSMPLYAEEYYAYHQENIPQELAAVEVYTEKEYHMLRGLGIYYRLSKFNSDLELIELQKKYSFKIERLQSVELFNYKNFQWYLNNKGGNLTRWITDIDTETVQTVAGEDIQLSSHIEEKSPVKVAVIDSGVDVKHPDLKHAIIRTESECKALAEYKACLADREQENETCHTNYATQDTDGNGYPLDCQGWSMTNAAYPGVKVTGNPEIVDNIGHGTHIAGIIAAAKDNKGINGISSKAKIIPIQVALSSASDSPIDNIAKGVLYAIQNQAQIINLSLGWKFQFDSKLMRDMVKAANQRGILIVVAAGNDSHSDISYPCAYDDVICVASHDQTGKLSSFSNRGTSVDLIAPGSDILSTWPTNLRSRLFTQDYNYEYMSGTSQAAPIVSGALAAFISHGLTPAQARISLLKGARSKLAKSDIRYGNLDMNQALKIKDFNFIYPLNKEPYIVTYKNSEENQVRVKIKNYGLAQSDISLSLESLTPGVTVVKNQIRIKEFKANDIQELDFALNIEDYQESELRFKLKVAKTEYIIRANIIRLIHPEIADREIEHISIDGQVDNDTILRPFENFDTDDAVDFLAVTSKKSTTKITILQARAEGYKLSRTLPIRDARPVFLNFSRIDIDQDGSSDYVITYVTADRDGNKTTKFLLFEETLLPKRYLIAPENKFDNKKTFIPGKFKWLSWQKKYVPAWIGFGENGTEVVASPWEPAPNLTNNYLYYLTDEGLQNFSFDSSLTLLHALYQSEKEKIEGKFTFLASSGAGFFKTYHFFEAHEGITPLTTSEFEDYFDLFEPRPLPFRQDRSNAFFNESGNGGSQNLFKLEMNNGSVESEFVRVPNPFERENIKFIKHVTDEFIFYQTDFKIVALERSTGAVSFRESKVNTKRRRLEVVTDINAVYLPAKEAPGFSGEIMTVNSSRSLTSLGQYRTLAINGCEEMGLVTRAGRSYLGYACLAAKKILFLPLFE